MYEVLTHRAKSYVFNCVHCSCFASDCYCGMRYKVVGLCRCCCGHALRLDYRFRIFSALEGRGRVTEEGLWVFHSRVMEQSRRIRGWASRILEQKQLLSRKPDSRCQISNSSHTASLCKCCWYFDVSRWEDHSGGR